ncbi:hypothetical protein [Chitinolyticbacter albus]|uniref:hypothetical protein n=1 Tax=Chitinolyticbacter albus TaxID=2961951 RepID=UPI00210D6611|nr:hypothetical protein [Chitinolyticbacter albus]
MMSLLFPALLIAYVLLAALFLAAAWPSSHRAKWLGVTAIAAAAPLFFWIGAFAEQFGAGQCYSDAIGMIANAVEGTDAPNELARKIRALPLRGYETVCSNVETAAQNLPNAGTP